MAIEVLSPKEHYRSYLNEKMSRNNPKRIYNDGGEKSRDILDREWEFIIIKNNFLRFLKEPEISDFIDKSLNYTD